MVVDPNPPDTTRPDRHEMEPREAEWFAAFDHAHDDMGRGNVDSARSASVHVYGEGVLL